MKTFVLIVTGVLVITGITSRVYYFRHNNNVNIVRTDNKEPGTTATNQQFITANPLDLTQIKAISKFRSCAGHDFSGMSDEGIVEADRSMKHYIIPVNALAGSVGKIKIYSPVTGMVDHYEAPHVGTGGANGTERGSGIWIGVDNVPLDVVLAHIDPVIPMQEGTKLQAGQLVGYANLGNSAGNDFDLVVQGKNRTEQYYSLFHYMTPDVLRQYADRGINLETIIVSKDYRDGHPCGYPGKNQEGNGTNTKYFSDFVEVK